MSDWVRFHRELRQGDKRGISRASRFVYLELCQEARARQGAIVLPDRMSDAVAVFDILGGNSREVRQAVNELTTGSCPMIAFSTTEDGKRVCVVINWAKWNNPDKTGTERQRKHRESRVTNGLVTRDTTVTHALVTKPEEIRGEESRKHPPTPLVTVTVPSRPIRNASDDGAMGMTVTAWSDGLSLVTGAPSSPLAAKAVQILVGALAAHRPVDAEPVAWSRQIAADYATANKNRTLSPFGFSDWLASGKPQKPAPANGAAPPKTGADPYAPPELRIEPIVGAATPAEVKEIFAELAKTLRRSEEATK